MRAGQAVFACICAILLGVWRNVTNSIGKKVTEVIINSTRFKAASNATKQFAAWALEEHRVSWLVACVVFGVALLVLFGLLVHRCVWHRCKRRCAAKAQTTNTDVQRKAFKDAAKPIGAFADKMFPADGAGGGEQKGNAEGAVMGNVGRLGLADETTVSLRASGCAYFDWSSSLT